MKRTVFSNGNYLPKAEVNSGISDGSYQESRPSDFIDRLNPQPEAEVHFCKTNGRFQGAGIQVWTSKL